MLVAALAVLGWGAQQAGIDLSEFGLGGGASSRASGAPSSAPIPGGLSESAQTIEAAVRDQRSGFMVTVEAEVVKNLPDDNKGSRHQRFLIELETGRTLLVAHNIDLARRVPLREGTGVRVRGQYEWNKKGGVLHWTHHDPRGKHPGGWIEYRGQRTE